MATGKTSTLTCRIEPALKDALRIAAEQEHRSVANMLSVMIRDYCGRNGVTIPEPRDLRLANATNRRAGGVKKR